MRNRGKKQPDLGGLAKLHVSVVSVDQQQKVSADKAFANTVSQCHAALLYGDTVDLISPSAALRQSLVKAGDLTDLELLRLSAEIGKARPGEKLSPESAAAKARILSFITEIDESILSPDQRNAYREAIKGMAASMAPLRETLREQALQAWEKSPFRQLQHAIDAGVLSITEIDGASVSTGDPTTVTEGLLTCIGHALSSVDRYPMFDLESLKYVDAGKEAGVFSERSVTQKRSADIAMAAGLIGLLPEFPHATTDEILDIRTHLAKPLQSFRTAVRELSSEVQASPQSADFEQEISDAFLTKVVPAIAAIDEELHSNSSLRDLLGRALKDGASLPGLTAAGSLAGGVALGSSAIANILLASGAAIGLSVATVRSYLAQGTDLQDVTDREFYFMYGANKHFNRRA
ncbi:hypothetical protein [Mycolicibacterium sp. XJ870]